MGKRLEAMRSNWRIDDIKALCAEHGIRCAAPRGGGSHYRISHPDLKEKLTVPFKRPVKPVYIRKLVAFIDRLENARNAP